MVLAGLGITAGFATLTGALMSQIPPRFYSMAGAARSTIFQLATAVGIAVAVAVLDAGHGDDLTSPYRRVWLIATACAVGRRARHGRVVPPPAADVSAARCRARRDRPPVAMLGTGLIGDFYTMTLHGRRGRDRVEVVYSRSPERGAAFAGALGRAARHDEHPRGRRAPGRRHRRRRPAQPPARGGRRHRRRGRQVRAVHEAAGPHGRGGRGGSSPSSSRPACSPATSRTSSTPRRRSRPRPPWRRRDRRRHVGPQPGDPPGSAQRLVLGRRPGRRRVHRRPRLPLHRGHPHVRRQDATGPSR